MQIDEFVRPYAEKLQVFKKTVFTLKHAIDFLQKLCERGDIDKMESELGKCLLNTSANRENDERRQFIANFVEAYRKFSSENMLIKTSATITPTTNINPTTNILPNPNKQGTSKGKEDFTIQRKFKVKNKDEEFPTLENIELVHRKKNFEVLDHHYSHKLEKGTKICFCMSSKHPLVGNCMNCGRIQCLQEGDQECIVCGNALLRKDEYLKQCTVDKDMKKAYTHKEKLLKFQAEFYSKLQIIDDFTDWYELSNNTWISKDHRELAKKKDEEIDRIREDPQYEYNVNFKTMEITKVYEEVDENKVKEDITNFFMESIRKTKEKEKEITNAVSNNSMMECRFITEKAINELNKLASIKNKEVTQKINYEGNIKKLSKRIDLDLNEKIGEEITSYNKNLLYNIELMTENDYYAYETDVGMCLSMHQPWASLVIEGFKRFEGRDWDCDYRGILWIHATSKKPEQELIDAVEGSYRDLYCKDKDNAKHVPKFPKRYPTSSLLGCVDLVDVLKREVYQKLIPNVFLEKSDSKFLFVCKNPRRLEIAIKMPGQPNLYKLEENVLERTKGKLIKVNTFWWPSPAMNISHSLIEIPFTLLLKPEMKTSSSNVKNKKGHNNFKIKLTNLYDEIKKNSITLIQNFITHERKENILSIVDSLKRDMTYYNDYRIEPFLHYGLKQSHTERFPIILQDMFTELQTFLRDEKKIKLDLSLNSIDVEYIDWYGCQNFRENKNKAIKLFIGNPVIMSFLTNFADNQGKSVRFECGDIVYLDENVLYTINQVLYDQVSTKIVKMKQGVVVVTFNCETK